MEKGGTGENIAAYMKTWEQWYALQLKMDAGKKLSAAEASNYDKWKAQLDAWDNDKQDKVKDLLALMDDEIEKLRETTSKNLADAEAEANSHYSKIYALAKQIAEYNAGALKEQLACLDAYINYCKELVSLYDRFSGSKLSKLLTDLDEGAMADQVGLYEKYLEKLQSVLKLLNERAVNADNWEEYADIWLAEWEKALAVAKVALLMSQLENAQSAANEYLELTEKIKDSKDTYALDKAYEEALAEATRNYCSSLSNAASIESQVDEIMKKAQKEEVDGLKEIMDLRKQILTQKKAYYDYDRNLKNKNKNIEALKAEIEALNDVETAQARAQKAQLEAKLAEAQDELKDVKMEHEFSISVNTTMDKIVKFYSGLNLTAEQLNAAVARAADKIVPDFGGFYESIGAMDFSQGNG